MARPNSKTKNKMKKRSQISMFIIVGIVLLVITGFLIYIVSYTVKKQTQRSVKTTQKQELRIKSIENYITTCLEKTTKKGLLLLGEQGGVIFKKQGGLSEETAGDILTKDADTKIMFGIKEPIMTTCNAGDGCFDCIPPDTDCKGYTCNKDGFCVIGCNIVDPDCGAGLGCGAGNGCYAGCSNDTDCGGATCNAGDGCIIACSPNLDPDCSIYTCQLGAERDGMCVLGCTPVDPDCDKNGDGFNIDAPLYPWRCFPKMIDCSAPPQPLYTGYFGRYSLPPLEDSIINQLKTFIANNITNCIDFDIFEEQGFDINAGAITVEKIVFTEKDTIVNLKYPLNIKHFKTGEKANLNKFSYSCGVNLKCIYNYAKEIIKRDTTNIIYNPNGQKELTFKIKVTHADHSSNKYDDIITITDNSSIIDGKPFEFSFARKNRMPALEFINDFTVTIGTVLTEAHFGNPQAYDPDEDVVNIRYECQLERPEDVCEIGSGAEWKIDKKRTFFVYASDGILEDYQEVDVTTILH